MNTLNPRYPADDYPFALDQEVPTSFLGLSLRGWTWVAALIFGAAVWTGITWTCWQLFSRWF